MDPFHPGHLRRTSLGNARRIEPPPLGRQVVRLPPHERLGARRLGEHPAAAGRGGGGKAADEGLEGKGLEGIAAEDGRRLVVRPVAGGATTAEIVVIHRRQVVMNERVGVDHLHRDGCSRRRLPDLGGGSLGSGWRAGPGGPQHEGRAETLSRREERIAHRLEQPRRGLAGELQSLFEPRFDEGFHPRQGLRNGSEAGNPNRRRPRSRGGVVTDDHHAWRACPNYRGRAWGFDRRTAELPIGRGPDRSAAITPRTTGSSWEHPFGPEAGITAGDATLKPRLVARRSRLVARWSTPSTGRTTDDSAFSPPRPDSGKAHEV